MRIESESIRTPLIIYDPRLQASSRGKRRQEIALNVDIAPTILDFAEIDIPEHMQGRSLRGLVYGKDEEWRDDFFYEHLFENAEIPKSEGVRTERWKYIRYIEQGPVDEELYDLQNDPYEEHNVAMIKNNGEILNKMRKRWNELRESLR